MFVYVCVCVCVCVCERSFVFMVWGCFVFFTLMWCLGSMDTLFYAQLDVSADYLDTCCFECLMCMCFVFLYLHLFSAIEHVSHEKAL